MFAENISTSMDYQIRSFFQETVLEDCRATLDHYLGIPIVTVGEKLRLEELAYHAGEKEEDFMENAAQGVAHEAENMLSHPMNGTITLLIGKGYKGGSALRAGTLLLQKGYSVQALLIAPLEECPPLCQEMGLQFQEMGGTLHPFHEDLLKTGLLIDGLVGTGFKGSAQGTLAQMIDAANRSCQPILAIDIPSGLNADTGEVGSVAITATRTATMALPKIGFFLSDGWEKIGELTVIDIGMPQKFLDQAIPEAYLVNDGICYLPSPFSTFDRFEMQELLSAPLSFETIQNFVDQQNQSILLRGPTEVLFQPGKKPIINAMAKCQ